ncbi:MAG TPA: DUF1707 domain-containing protein [Streptosporangiaceae bacterium]|nr:DUF1707 domain-containing protein [Streptosporangiaceae bacterium]
MDDRQKMRASDADRQEVIERLRTALDEGRLKVEEYIDRMGQASEAVTYADLAPLYADLPESGAVARPDPRPPAPAAERAAPPPVVTSRRGLPTALKVLWTIWGAVVSVNLVVWVLVSATTAHLIYPWPLWVAGPWGAVLLAVTVGVRQIGRGSHPGHRPLPPGQT